MKSHFLNIDECLILIIDVQEKLLEAQFNKEILLENVSMLAQAAKILEIPVVVSEQYPKGLGSTINSIKEKLPEDTKFFEKTSFNCCFEDDFVDIIRSYNKKQIIVAGMESHVCVHQTVYCLISRGYEVHILEDAISSRKEHNFQLGIKKMESNGARPSSVETAIFELLRTAKHPKFKEIQAIIK